MRKVSAWVLAMGLVVGLLAGCGVVSKSQVSSKLQTQEEKLDAVNYKSTAMMTVQMDNGSQTYYIQTDFDSPDVYKIALGDANKNINQVIVRNNNGMFVVSPALQKVFRFNGNWAQNQGHIYLYDQILHQIVTDNDVKMSKKGNSYLFTMSMTPENDVVSRQQVEIDAQSLAPKKIVLFDKDDKAVVTINFTSFQTNVQYSAADFDPQKIAQGANVAKTTWATDNPFGYVEPADTLGNKLDFLQPQSDTEALLRYTGDHPFTLDEWRPDAGVAGLPAGQLVDLFGVPAMYSGSGPSHQLTWINNGVEFALTSSKLTLEEMKQVAISTLGQVGK